MATLDWIVLLLFIGVLIGIVWWVLKNKTAFGAAIFVANIGSEHLVGLAGAEAESGMAIAH